jgi:hypothetical protein
MRRVRGLVGLTLVWAGCSGDRGPAGERGEMGAMGDMGDPGAPGDSGQDCDVREGTGRRPVPHASP